MPNSSQLSCWPTLQQELLLKASFLKGEEAVSAWEKWKSGLKFEQIDPGSYRLLPILYYNISLHGVKDPMMNNLKGVYLQTWHKNQILFHKLGTLLSAFHNAEIQTMVLKGAALTRIYYRDYGLRPMGDIDVLVRTKQAEDAMSLLRRMNWITNIQPAERLIPIAHAAEFKNDSGQSFDLHWHVLHECLQEHADDDFWEAAIPIKIDNLSTHALNSADQLLHICAHGTKWNSAPPFRWMADAATIIKTSQSIIDWSRLITQTERRRLILPVRDTLNYLSDKLAIPIPEDTLRIMSKMRTTRMEQVEYRYKLENCLQKPFGYLPIFWFDYSRLEGNKSLPLKFLGFLNYLQQFWGAQNIWQLARYAMSMSVRKIRTIANYYWKRSRLNE